MITAAASFCDDTSSRLLTFPIVDITSHLAFWTHELPAQITYEMLGSFHRMQSNRRGDKELSFERRDLIRLLIAAHSFLSDCSSHD